MMPEDDDPKLRAARARVGQRLHNRWLLQRLLGVGGMGAVFEATGPNGARVALKLLHDEMAQLGDARMRFAREGYVASRIEHPGAVQVLEDHCGGGAGDDGAVYLVMEFLDGETVEQRRERAGGKLSLDEALVIADQALEVLAAAHDKTIVHRDVKPENLFVTRDGRLKVLDFGIARLRETQGNAHATRTGTAMGTPAFMPPEQALGQWDKVSARTDIWALGATLFKVLTGRDPHEAPTLNQLLLAVMTKPVPSVASLAPKVPSKIAKVIDKALAFDAQKRFATARDMREALRKAYEASAKRRFDALPALGELAAQQRAGFAPTMPAQPGIAIPAMAPVPGAPAHTQPAMAMPALLAAEQNAAREKRQRVFQSAAIASVFALLFATAAAFGVRAMTGGSRALATKALGETAAHIEAEVAQLAARPPEVAPPVAPPEVAPSASATAEPTVAPSAEPSVEPAPSSTATAVATATATATATTTAAPVTRPTHVKPKLPHELMRP